MPFNPKITDQPNNDKSHYHRNDFVTALLLDNIGALPSSPGGDIAVSGNMNQFTPITEQTRVRQDKTQIWQPPQFFKTSVYIGNGCEVYRNDLPVNNHPPQFRLFDGPDNQSLSRWLADTLFGFNISYFENESPINTVTGDPLVLYLGSVGINGIIPNAGSYALDVNGAAHASSFPTSSDEKLKCNIQPLSDSLNKLLKLNCVSFEWNQYAKSIGRSYPTGTQIGLIAQNVQTVFPELVTEWNNQPIKGGQACGPFLAVDYDRLIPVVIDSIRQLLDRIEQLEGKVYGKTNPKPQQ